MRDAGFGGKAMTTLGILTIILGVVALMAPSITGLSIAVFIGALVLVGGIFRLIWSFRAGSFGRGLVSIALGVLTVVAGVIMLSDPLLAAGMLTVLLAIYFIVDGIAEVLTGFGSSPESGRGWLILGGMVSILLGVILWAQYPLSGDWALGILFGIKLVFIGLIIISGARAVRA